MVRIVDMQAVIALVFAWVSVAAVTDAHVCLLSPPQRGSLMNINKPGAADCNLETGPCGGRKRGNAPLQIKAGSKFLVAFQKNLDHFDADTPGCFNITVSFNQEKTFEFLQVIPDTSDPSLSLYYKNVTMPNDPIMQNGTLRVTYVTRNPEAPAVFYQCSDVTLYK